MKRNFTREYKLFDGYEKVHNKSEYIIEKFNLTKDSISILVDKLDYYELCDYFEVKPQVLRIILNKFNILKTKTHCRNCGKLCLDLVKYNNMLGCSKECCDKLYKDFLDKESKELPVSTKLKISEAVLNKYKLMYGDIWYNFKYDENYRYAKLEELKEKYKRKLHIDEIASELGLSVNSIRHELAKEEYDEYIYRKYYNTKENSLEEILASLGFNHNSHRDFSLRFSNDTIKFPDYYNEDEHIVLEFNGIYWHKDEGEYHRFNKLSKDIHQLYEWMYEYNNYGYKLCVIWEDGLDEFFVNIPKSLDELLEKYEVKKKYDFYVAGPFFNEDQLKSMEIVESILTKYNKTMFRPRYDAGKIDLLHASNYDCYQTFRNDLLGIEASKVILANTTFKDSGTSVEIGYADNLKHTDIWLLNDNETSGKMVNLMLAQAADNSFSSYNELDEYLSKDTDEEFRSQFDIE